MGTASFARIAVRSLPRGLSSVLRIAALASATACSAAPISLGTGGRRAIDPAELEQFVVSVVACHPSTPAALPYWPGVVTGGNLWPFEPDVPFAYDATARACVAATHGDCVEIMGCLGYSVRASAASESECIAAAGTLGCQSDVRVSCERLGATWYVLAQRCSALDGAICGASRCGLPCTPPESVCVDEHVALLCGFDGTASRYSCDPGTRCANATLCDGGPGCRGPICVPTGSSCDHDVCDGDFLVMCDNESYLTGNAYDRFGARWDCRSAGMRCRTSSGRAACEAPASECVNAGPFVGPVTCAGDVLTYCGLDRRVHRYDCVAHGFASCADRSGGAACVPVHGWP